MSTRKEKAEQILEILREKNGKAPFGYVFTRMSETHSLTKTALKSCLDDLRTAGRIDYPPLYMAMDENSVLIKLTEKREYPR